MIYCSFPACATLVTQLIYFYLHALFPAIHNANLFTPFWFHHHEYFSCHCLSFAMTKRELVHATLAPSSKPFLLRCERRSGPLRLGCCRCNYLDFEALAFAMRNVNCSTSPGLCRCNYFNFEALSFAMRNVNRSTSPWLCRCNYLDFEALPFAMRKAKWSTSPGICRCDYLDFEALAFAMRNVNSSTSPGLCRCNYFDFEALPFAMRNMNCSTLPWLCRCNYLDFEALPFAMRNPVFPSRSIPMGLSARITQLKLSPPPDPFRISGPEAGKLFLFNTRAITDTAAVHHPPSICHIFL
ncbi:unnamed protein product [Acanthosepion pharaonis]|uniref:Uncharacterized protein n=1 Tax=Acanthosepion pharaonis TaxID=158019 RepID=A0A812DD73_ACAPH|nr:unnamed protein product [Sepia pharaonis]